MKLRNNDKIYAEVQVCERFDDKKNELFYVGYNLKFLDKKTDQLGHQNMLDSTLGTEFKSVFGEIASPSHLNGYSDSTNRLSLGSITTFNHYDNAMFNNMQTL